MLGGFDPDLPTRVEHQHQPTFGPERLLQARQGLAAQFRRDEMQCAVHQHDVELPPEIEIDQILLSGGDRQGPPVGEVPAQVQRRPANVQRYDARRMGRCGACCEREKPGVRAARDQYIAASLAEELVKLVLQLARFDSRGHPGQTDVRPQCVQVATRTAQTRRQTVGFGRDFPKILDVGGSCVHGRGSPTVHFAASPRSMRSVYVAE
jgi:hypothetical protein